MAREEVRSEAGILVKLVLELTRAHHTRGPVRLASTTTPACVPRQRQNNAYLLMGQPAREVPR